MTITGQQPESWKPDYVQASKIKEGLNKVLQRASIMVNYSWYIAAHMDALNCHKWKPVNPVVKTVQKIWTIIRIKTTKYDCNS